jgi:hypothetical protein
MHYAAPTTPARRATGAPPDWRLSAEGAPVHLDPQGAARHVAITHHYYAELTHEQRMDRHWDPDTNETWNAFFANRRETELASYEGN